jgi:endonuclease YncB( thermonuclease family)
MWRVLMMLAGWIPLMACAETYFALVTKVSDGDTVWVKPDGNAAPRKLRLQGLDAPEICQAGGQNSRDALANLVLNVRVQVSVKYEDDYGRGLARLSVNGQDVGAKLVAAGQAWSSRWQRSLGPYAQEEAQAKAAKLGLFAQSQPEMPRDFRKRFGSCFPVK